MADTSTQREVVVECFAPYDDHRWVNIGKVQGNSMECMLLIYFLLRSVTRWPPMQCSMLGL